MFSDDFYVGALDRQATAVDVASVRHAQDLIDGVDDADSARVLAFEVGAYREMVRRATPVQLLYHAASRAKSVHSR